MPKKVMRSNKPGRRVSARLSEPAALSIARSASVLRLPARAERRLVNSVAAAFPAKPAVTRVPIVLMSHPEELKTIGDRKSTRLNSSHGYISYAVFCLKKKKKNTNQSYTIVNNYIEDV